MMIRDNDIHLLLSLSNNRVLALRVNGRTTRSEIELNEFDEKEMILRFGIQQQKVSELGTPLLDAIKEHITTTSELCELTALDTIMDSIVQCVNEGARPTKKSTLSSEGAPSDER